MNNNENLSENDFGLKCNSTDNNSNDIDETSNDKIKEHKVKSQNLTLFISLAAIIIAVAAVIMPFIINIQKEEKEKKTDSLNKNINTNAQLTAYINTDSLLLKYEYSIKINEDLLTEQQKSKANLSAMYLQFENKYNAFMEKAKLGSFLSQESMDRQQQELLQEQQRLQTLEETMSQKLMEKQVAVNSELLDTVVNFLKEYNKDKKYSMILNNAVVLYGNQSMDITNEITSALNDRYKTSKK